LHPIRTTTIVSLITAVAAIVGGAPALGATHHAPVRAKVATASTTISTLTVLGSAFTVSGSVSLSPNTAAVRKRTRVVVALSDASHKRELQTVKLRSNRAYRVSWVTTLQGPLTIAVRATISGKPSGGWVTRTLTVIPTPTPTPVPPPAPPAPAPTPLIGTFRLTAGAAPNGQAPTGSYFEMLTSSGAPFGNISSPAPNKNYTPLTPGTDGGLRTDAYQQAPNPAFSGGVSGGALANKIIQPVSFYLINFSIQTSAADAQLGIHDPLPSIAAQNGKLSGQVTAWDAQWNGQSFNQGTPKPGGSVLPPTTPLSGTYDPTTHKFTLDWKSLIVGGPFNGYTGVWHLAGTFVPASTATGP
jgi:hypothetical protein